MESTTLMADCGAVGKVIFVPESEKNLLVLQERIGKDIKVSHCRTRIRPYLHSLEGMSWCFARTSGLLSYDW
jgi:hypothetical protein